MSFQLLVLMETANNFLETFNIFLEFSLIRHHCVVESVSFSYQIALSILDKIVDILGPSKDLPLSIKILLSKLILELIHDFIVLHNLLDVFRHLDQLSWKNIQKVLQFDKLFDTFRDRSHLSFHADQLTHQIYGSISGSSSQELNKAPLKPLILACKHLKDLLIAYQETGDMALVWDLVPELFLLLLSLENLIFNGILTLGRVFIFKFLDICIWVKFKNMLEHVKGILIFSQGLNGCF
mmetsp:Transcript_23914/g.20885  ORF Transcript_23914/g.20885 Transcript_23914/m.20885 type:complete len:238 (-) Transcript_23914:568-1281(-)